MTLKNFVKFIKFSAKSTFLNKKNDISDNAIVFIEDTNEIYLNGQYYPKHYENINAIKKLFFDDIWLAIGNESLGNSSIDNENYPDTPYILGDNKYSYSDAVYYVYQTLPMYEARQYLFIDLWKTAVGNCGGYKPDDAPDENHPFLLNEVWLTYQEALRTYYYGAITNNAETFYGNVNIRTNLPRNNSTYAMPYDNTFRGNTNIEIVECRNAKFTKGTFYNCTKLRKIIGKDNMGAYQINTDSDNAASVFQNCINLEFIKGEIRTINQSHTYINVKDCPKLTLENFQYWFEHAYNTVPITIVVHPDVLAKLTGDLTNEAAAMVPPPEMDQWVQLPSLLASKNLQIVGG